MAFTFVFYFLNLFGLFKFLENTPFLPLKIFEARTSFSPNLVGFTKDFPDIYSPKVEYLVSEDLYFMSYGTSIVIFKRGNSNFFGIECEELSLVSFALIEGKNYFLVNGISPSDNTTRIAKYDWRRREYVEEIISLREPFSDIIHISGTNLLFIYSQDKAILIDIENKYQQDVQNFEEGAKGCNYDYVNELLVCQHDDFIKVCELQKDLICYKKNFPIHLINLKFTENGNFTIFLGNSKAISLKITPSNEDINLDNVVEKFQFENQLKVLYANPTEYLAYDNYSIRFIDFKDIKNCSEPIFFLSIKEVLISNLNKSIERSKRDSYAFVALNNETGFVLKKGQKINYNQSTFEVDFKLHINVSVNYIFKSINNTDMLLFSREKNFKFFDMKKNEVICEFYIDREVEAFDFIEDKIILMTTTRLEIFYTAIQKYTSFNEPYNKTKNRLLAFTCFTSSKGNQLSLLIFQLGLKYINLRSATELVSTLYASDGKQTFLQSFEINGIIYFIVVYNVDLLVIAVDGINNSIKLRQNITGFSHFDFFDTGIAISFSNYVLVFTVDILENDLSIQNFTISSALLPIHEFKYFPNYIASFPLNIIIGFENDNTTNNCISKEFANSSEFCLRECDTQNKIYLNISSLSCSNSCFAKYDASFNQELCKASCPEFCQFCTNADKCLICESGYFKKDNICISCKSKFTKSCDECNQKFCLVTEFKPLQIENSEFPRWAIALIVTLPSLLLILLVLLVWKKKNRKKRNKKPPVNQALSEDNTKIILRINGDFNEGTIPMQRLLFYGSKSSKDTEPTTKKGKSQEKFTVDENMVIKEYEDLISKNEALIKYNEEFLKTSLSKRELIAKGGFAAVYKINYNEKIYAVKTVRSGDLEEILRCLVEIKTIYQLSSDFVISTYWLYLNKLPDCSFEINLIMKYVPNNLDELICLPDSFKVSELQRIDIFKTLISGIIHFQNFMTDYYILHGDIKPKNILVETDREGKYHNIYFADFGIAFLLNKTTKFQQINSMTKGYAAPEQKKDNILTSKSDLYSIGLVALELFTYKLTEAERDNLGLSQESFEFTWKTIVDKRNYSEKIKSVFKIIHEMLTIDWQDRPTPKEVLAKLVSL